MSVEELIQLIRTCNLAQVRTELERLKIRADKGHSSSSTTLFEVEFFYTSAARQPK